MAHRTGEMGFAPFAECYATQFNIMWKNQSSKGRDDSIKLFRIQSHHTISALIM